MFSNLFAFRNFLFLAIVLMTCLNVSAQKKNVDSLLVQREESKWDALKTKSFGTHSEWFAKDFAAIGYLPDASVYRTGFGDKVSLPKMDDLPSAEFVLSGFKIVNAAKGVKIISYKADGPLNLYITTVWAERGKGWKTVFYQATKYK